MSPIRFNHETRGRTKDAQIVCVHAHGILSLHRSTAQRVIVNVGEAVVCGQVLAEPLSPFAVFLRSSAAGCIHAISDTRIEIAAAEQAQDALHMPALPPDELPRAQVVERARMAGLIGQGGAGFPTHIKLGTDGIHTLIVNAVECEPYITNDYRRLLEHAPAIADGIRIAARVLAVRQVIVAYERDYGAAIDALQTNLREAYVRWKPLQGNYPSGEGRLLVQAVGGPVIRRPVLEKDFGYAVMNVNTLYHLAEAVLRGRPVTHRLVTLSGDAMPAPGNFEVPIGLTLDELLRQTGNQSIPDGIPLRLGGPMMSPQTVDRQTPVTQTTLAVLAMTQRASERLTRHCVGCLVCSESCPVCLVPKAIRFAVNEKDTRMLERLRVHQCLECGACEYACPRGGALMQDIRAAKRLLNIPVLPFAAPALRVEPHVLPDCFYVVASLLPLLAFSTYQWGLGSLFVWLGAVFGAVLAEALYYLILSGRKEAVGHVSDYTAATTGLLLAATLPAGFSPYIAAVAAAVAVVGFKLICGGVGRNLLNPALVARAGLMVLCARAMTTWPAPLHASLDALTAATPLGQIHEHGVDFLLAAAPPLTLLRELFTGNHAGSLGETSVALCLLAYIFLVAVRVIKWHTPLLFLGAFSLVFLGLHRTTCLTADTWLLLAVHLCSGSLALGAVYYVTDYVTAPHHWLGRATVPVIAGGLTCVLREQGYYPEGVCYGVLAAQMLRPAFDFIGDSVLLPRPHAPGMALVHWIKPRVRQLVLMASVLAATGAIAGVLQLALTPRYPDDWPENIRAAVTNRYGWHLTARVSGYAAPMIVAFDVNDRGMVSNVTIVTQHETTGLGSGIAGQAGAAFRASLNGLWFNGDAWALRALDPDGGVESISGATITCGNVLHGVRNAIEDFEAYHPFLQDSAK